MDLEHLNKQYFLRSNMYDAVLNGISSRLYTYSNGIMYIEVFISTRWKKNYSTTAFEVAQRWRKSMPELRHSIGCKVHITDLGKHHNAKTLRQMGIDVPYHSKKGILFFPNQLN